MKSNGFTLIELIICIVIVGLLAAIAIPNYVRMTDGAKEARVMSNCHAVQTAVEYFAVLTEGEYAADLSEIAPNGETLLDLVSKGGALLENPFTKVASQPVDGLADEPGETGYESRVDADGLRTSYSVSGYGKRGLVIVLSN